MVDQKESIRRCKQLLIATTPSKLIKDLKNDQNNGNDSNHILSTFINKELITQYNFLFSELSQHAKNDDQLRLLVTDSLAIWMLRVNQFLTYNKAAQKLDTSKLLDSLKNDLLTFDRCNYIFEYIIDFWNDSSHALLNALKDLFNKFLTILKLIYAKNDLNKLFTQWLDQIIQISSTLKVQYYLIETLSLDTDMYHLLEKKPDFITDSLKLMSSESLSASIGKCLAHLLINIYNFHFKADLKEISKWYALWQNDIIYYLHLTKYSKPLKLYFLTPLFKQMSSNVFIDFINSIKSHGKISNDPTILLSLLKIGQELDIDDEPFHNDKLISISQLEQFLDNDELKLSAFELLTFTKKKSKTIHPYVISILKRHLRNFFVDINLETRNYFESSFKLFILRIRDSCYSLQRDVNKLKRAQKFPKEQEDKLTQIDQYKQFLIWLFRFLKKELIPGIQYQRCLMSLNILLILIDSGLDEYIQQKDVSKQNFRSWPFNLAILNDKTYLRLLIDNLISPVNDIRKFVKHLLSQSYNSNIAVRETIHSIINEESLSKKAIQNINAYQNTEAGATIEMFLFNISDDKLQLIMHQLNQLKEENDKTEKRPLENVVNNISGCYTILTMFLTDVNLDSFPSDKISVIIKDLLVEVMRSWNISKDLMCHDSSNGLLPDKYLQSSVSDQVITSYTFRTVKELSKLLNLMITKFTLTQEQLIQIGDLLILQLFTIRHSGCFQAVLPTFRTFCVKGRRLIPTQLKVWLDNILVSLESKTQHITRRSGGLPFLITNILATETEKDRPELKYVFDKLLSILETASTMEYQDKLDLPQINAFNCIKAIFIESQLAEACAPYFPLALEYSLRYFNSDIWALRNCSLMLFTSLQNRIFGKIGKNISARLFFTKYDGIDMVLLRILQQSIGRKNRDSNNMESTILVLCILMCLRQTPGYSGLDPFVNEVVKCLENKNWKIRDMAARTLSIMIDETHIEGLHLMENCSIRNQNKLHGHLLAVKNIISGSQNSSHMICKINDLLQKLFKKRFEFIILNPSYVTVKAYLEILFLIFNDEKFDVSIKSFKQEIISIFGNYFINNFYSKENSYNIDGSKELCLSLVLNFLLKYEAKANINSLIRLGLESNLYEVQLEAIKYLEASGPIMEDSDDLSDVIEKLVELLLNEDTLVTLKPPIIGSLNRIPNNKMTLNTLIKFINDTKSEACKLSAMECLGNYVSYDNEIELIWDNIIKGYLTDCTNEMFRKSTLNCLINCSNRLLNVKVFIQIFRYLQDDDPDIREEATVYLNKYIGKGTIQRTSDYISNKISDVILEEFAAKKDMVVDICVTNIKNFFHSNDIYGYKEQFEGLFEKEKDNQFRNDIEENLRWINLIKRCNDTLIPDLKQFIVKEKDKLLNYLNTNNIVDEPLGWMHSDEVLSRIIVLRQLIYNFDHGSLEGFDKCLKKHKSHPIIFEYNDISIN